MALLMDISAGISLANIGVLIGLLTLYVKVYRSTRAAFTIGLMFFTSMLMIHNIITAYAYFAMAPLYAESLLPYFLMIHVAELAGISALFKITI